MASTQPLRRLMRLIWDEHQLMTDAGQMSTLDPSKTLSIQSCSSVTHASVTEMVIKESMSVNPDVMMLYERNETRLDTTTEPNCAVRVQTDNLQCTNEKRETSREGRGKPARHTD